MGRKQKTLTESVPSVRQMFVRFWPLIRKQRMLLAGSSLALFAGVGARLLEPWPLKFIIDDVLMVASNPAPGTKAAGTLDPATILILAAVALVVIATLRAVINYAERVGFALAGNRVLTECRSELFAHLQSLSLSFHTKHKTGDLIMRVTGDIGRLKQVAVTALTPLVAQAVTLIGMLSIMLWMNWRLALIGVAIVPLFLLTTRRIGGRIRRVARRQRKQKGEMGAAANEAIGAIKVVQALSLEHVHQRSFTAANRADLRHGVKAKRLSARLIGTTDVLIAAATAGVMWYGATLVLAGALSAGKLLVFLAYLKMAFRPMRNLAKYSSRISKAAASAERIVEVMDITPLIRNRPDAVKAPRTVTAVAFEDVTFGYEPNHTALEAITLEARPGQVIVLAGPSGAGKSTVVNLLLRLYDPDSGRVVINGRDLREYTIESVRRLIALVPQENVLFGVSARDNIAFGAPGATDDQVFAAARLARAHEFITALPKGYDTVLGERGETLSEGERKRIAVARAAIRGAPILVLDEPTASLDNENNQLIRASLRELSADRITFIIAHDLSTVHDDNLVLYLDHGRVVEQGTHVQLLERGGRYAAMCALHGDPPGRDGLREAHAVIS